MNKKILILGLVGLFVCFSCNNKKEEPKPEEEIVYDGNISYISASVYDNREDTVGEPQPTEPAAISICNLNILADDVTQIEGCVGQAILFYAMDANIPAGDNLKVVLQSAHPLGWPYVFPAENWSLSSLDNRTLVAEVIQGGIPSHAWIGFFPNYNEDVFQIKFYRNGETQPYKTKTLQIHFPCYIPPNNPNPEPEDSTWYYN